jgi:hypothetical protein
MHSCFVAIRLFKQLVALGTLLTALALPALASVPSVSFLYGEDPDYLEFEVVEVSIDLPTPYTWTLGYGRTAVSLWLEFTAGHLQRGNDSAILAGLGPRLAWHITERLNFSMAVLPSFVSNSRFQDFDLGDSFHFATDVTLRYALNEKLSFQCRLQHLSNAHLAKPNPGLNFVLLGMHLEL